MKHLRCIDPTKYLLNNEIYLCSLVYILRDDGKKFEFDTDSLLQADYVYVQTVYTPKGHPLRVKANRFEEIPEPKEPLFQQPNHTFMKKEEPHYTCIDIDGHEVEYNLSRQRVGEFLNRFSNDDVIKGIEDGTIIVLKHTNGQTDDISDSIKFKPQIP